jgi:hypothetical protein
MIQKVKTNYSGLSQPDYADILEFIIFCLTNNLNFPDLPNTITDILAKKTDYEKALLKSKKGDHESTAQAKTYRKELDLMLSENGVYVNFTSRGDEAKLLSSGYDLAKKRVFAKKPLVDIILSSQPGEVKIVLQRVKNAVSYQVFIAAGEIPPADKQYLWVRKPMNTKTYQLLTGLKPLTQYYLIFCSLTKDGESPMSEPTPFMILK